MWCLELAAEYRGEAIGFEVDAEFDEHFTAAADPRVGAVTVFCDDSPAGGCDDCCGC